VAKTDYNTETLKRIGNKLRMLRVGAGYGSYETFAVDNDLSRRYYWGAEKGQNLSLKYLLNLLQIHNITLQDFFKDIEKY
jgi:hypothetical protein